MTQEDKARTYDSLVRGQGLTEGFVQRDVIRLQRRAESAEKEVQRLVGEVQRLTETNKNYLSAIGKLIKLLSTAADVLKGK